jgi:hypothetical protein
MRLILIAMVVFAAGCAATPYTGNNNIIEGPGCAIGSTEYCETFAEEVVRCTCADDQNLRDLFEEIG